jgi:hypothetical protein
MPAERVSMQRVREILRLKFECGPPTAPLPWRSAWRVAQCS